MQNQTIINYTITREIGSGGMATVYEAVHNKLDTKVAIKILDPLLAANENIRQRFMQEAKIMASLNHEGITKVLDFDEEESRLAIIMEYLEGQTLDEYVKQKGALSEARAKEIFIPILEAFAYAHSKGIVHRDVKPSNIFINTEGKVKIMDFGIAKIIEDDANVLTQTGTQMGTPVYMSPEQVNDSKHTDHRTDIYSLGVTLWFMLAGKPPYNTDEYSSFQIFTKIVNTELPELKDLPKIDQIIKKATHKKPDERIENCETFIDLLGPRAPGIHIGSENTIIENVETAPPPKVEIDIKKDPIIKATEDKKAEDPNEEWYKIKDSNEPYDFINFRKKFPFSQYAKQAKNNALFELFGKTFPGVKLRKSMQVILITSFLYSILLFFNWLLAYLHGWGIGLYTWGLNNNQPGFPTELRFFNLFSSYHTIGFLYSPVFGMLILFALLFGLIYLYININKSLRNRLIILSKLWAVYISIILSIHIPYLYYPSPEWHWQWQLSGLGLSMNFYLGLFNVLGFLFIIFYTIKSKVFSLPKLLKQINRS